MRDFPYGRGAGHLRGWPEDGRGRGGPFGEHGRGERGHRGRGGRGFGHGGLRVVLLKLLSDKPSHGYELIRAIEDRFNGQYAPSPGVVYPALSWLEDGGFITITPDAEGRKVATITEAGTAFLADRAEEVERLFAEAPAQNPDGMADGPDFAPLFRAMDNLKAALRNRASRPLTQDELHTIVDGIDDLARRIERS